VIIEPYIQAGSLILLRIARIQLPITRQSRPYLHPASRMRGASSLLRLYSLSGWSLRLPISGLGSGLSFAGCPPSSPRVYCPIARTGHLCRWLKVYWPWRA